MNIKNILLFPLICITNINAITIGENIEITEKEWRKCQNSYLYSLKVTDCKQQKQAYKKAYEKFTDSFKNDINKGLQAAKTEPSWFGQIKTKEEQKQAILSAYILAGFSDPKNRLNPAYYENKEKFCDAVIDTFALPCAPSTIVSDRLGGLNATEEELKKAKKTVREIIQQHLAQEITLE